MRIFLTGGTGFVGSYIRAALREAGHEVMALVRECPPEERGTTWVRGGLGDVDLLTEALHGCGAAVHLVGIIRERGASTFQRIHVQGTEHVLQAMQRAGVTRLVHMSALGAGANAGTDYFRTKWEAEEAVRAAGVAFTIFRPSIIFGLGDGFISLLVQQIRHLPVVPVIGTGAYPMAPISVHAVAAAFMQAVTMDGPALGTFELCGPEVLTYEEILDLLMAHMHRRRPKAYIPLGLMRFATGTAHAAHLPLPITRDQLTMLLAGSVCREHTAQEVFQLPQITLGEGVGEYVHR